MVIGTCLLLGSSCGIYIHLYKNLGDGGCCSILWIRTLSSPVPCASGQHTQSSWELPIALGVGRALLGSHFCDWESVLLIRWGTCLRHHRVQSQDLTWRPTGSPDPASPWVSVGLPPAPALTSVVAGSAVWGWVLCVWLTPTRWWDFRLVGTECGFILKGG